MYSWRSAPPSARSSGPTIPATTLLVPKEQLGRSSGMVQVSEAVAQILSPVIAGVLMGVIGIHGVILVDVATFLVALGAGRRPRAEAAGDCRGEGGTGHRSSTGLFRLDVHPRPARALGLLVFFAATNFASGSSGCCSPRSC